jgi:ethanolamine ammonia-lyase small subunit
MPEADDEIVATYTRAQALEDGVLIDISDRAKEAGIRVPTAVTLAVWSKYVELTPAAAKAGCDVEGRCWDIIWMFRRTARRVRSRDAVLFDLEVVTECVEPSTVTLKAVIGPGDSGEPILTIMEPNED